MRAERTDIVATVAQKLHIVWPDTCTKTAEKIALSFIKAGIVAAGDDVAAGFVVVASAANVLSRDLRAQLKTRYAPVKS